MNFCCPCKKNFQTQEFGSWYFRFDRDLTHFTNENKKSIVSYKTFGIEQRVSEKRVCHLSKCKKNLFVDESGQASSRNRMSCFWGSHVYLPTGSHNHLVRL